VAISAETSRLQTELLQLSLLHRSAGEVDRQWRASAKQKLHQRFDEVVQREAGVRRAESGLVEEENVKAIAEWASSSPSGGVDGVMGVVVGLETRIQVLDQVLCGVWGLVTSSSSSSSSSSLSSGGGGGERYGKVVRRFERWVERAERVFEVRGQRRGRQRQSDDDGIQGLEDQETGELLLIGELEPAWKDECAVLGRRLDEWRRRLRELEWEGQGQGKEGGGDGMAEAAASSSSSLARILSGVRDLVHGMLEELDLMEKIEREVVAEENRWVREMNREDEQQQQESTAAAGGTSYDNTSKKAAAGAIWRRV